MTSLSQSKPVKIFNIFCSPCLQINKGECSEHPRGCKYCKYCTDLGCDSNTCSLRMEDEDLISKYYENTQKYRIEGVPQEIVLAFERADDFYRRYLISKETKGLKGLVFLEKVQSILDASLPDPLPLKPMYRPKAQISIYFCSPCLQINKGECAEHPRGYKYCNYCTEPGCDSNTCPLRMEDEDLISEYYENTQKFCIEGVPQEIALAFERADDFYRRYLISKETFGLKGLAFLEKVQSILDSPLPDPLPLKPMYRPKAQISICLDCQDFRSSNGCYQCELHRNFKNVCLTCRNDGHPYQDCVKWKLAKNIFTSSKKHSDEVEEPARNTIVDTLIRLHIVKSLQMKGRNEGDEYELSRSNEQIIDDSIRDAFFDFQNNNF